MLQNKTILTEQDKNYIKILTQKLGTVQPVQWLGYGSDNFGIMAELQEEYFSLFQSTNTGSVANLDSNFMGTRGLSSMDRAGQSTSWPPTIM